MWYLNYCSPFIYSSSGSYQTVRYIMYSCLAFELLLYIFFIAKYKFIGKTIKLKNQLQEAQDKEAQMHVIRQAKTYQAFGDREFRLDQKQFKEWYLHYFGLNSIGLGGCIMYAAYTPQLIFALIHTISFFIATIMHSCEMTKVAQIIYNISMVVAVLMSISLLFSTTMGVGASGFDENSKNCYLNL